MAHIIFDFDGTIADTFPVVLEIFHHVSRRQVELTADESRVFRGLAFRQIKGKAMLHHAAQLHVPWWRVPFLFLVCREILKSRMRDVAAMPGMPELIKVLHDQGDTLAIVSSNSAANIEVFLRKEHLRSYFSHIYGGIRSSQKAVVLGRMKNRAPEQYEDAWLIGDEGRDIRAAHLAGMKSAAVLWGYNEAEQLEAERPTFIAEDSQQLLKALTDRIKG
jgi:phosphoglycolate phosphatase